VIGVFIRDVHGTGRSARHDAALNDLESRGIKVYFGRGLGEAQSVAKALGFGTERSAADIQTDNPSTRADGLS
jgi:hypothetical protein